MNKFKQCAACRYCRVNAFVKLSAVMLIGVVVSIVMVFEHGVWV